MPRTLVFFLCLLACWGQAAETGAQNGPDRLTIAAPPGIMSTGITQHLAQKFKDDTGLTISWVEAEAEWALEMARDCEVDMILANCPAAETKAVEAGICVDRTRFMDAEHVILGPGNDPARIRGLPVGEALARLSGCDATFLSLQGAPETLELELDLWTSAGLEVPDGQPWYRRVRTTPLKSIASAARQKAYILAPRTALIRARAAVPDCGLDVLVQGQDCLRGDCSMLAVNPLRCRDAAHRLVVRFTRWLTSPGVQKEIGEYEMRGIRVFVPSAK